MNMCSGEVLFSRRFYIRAPPQAASPSRCIRAYTALFPRSPRRLEIAWRRLREKAQLLLITRRRRRRPIAIATATVAHLFHLLVPLRLLLRSQHCADAALRIL